MSTFSVDNVQFNYTDYTDHDVDPSSVFFGEDTAGFTMSALLTNIPQVSPLTGQPTFCALVVSFGDPNYGPRIGKRVTFGPNNQDFPIEPDGIIVVSVTVGYFGSNNFGIVGGNTVNIPVGLAGSTLAGYFDKGNLPEQSYLGTLTVNAAESVPQSGGGGEPPLTEQPENLQFTDFNPQPNDNMDVTVEVDYFNNAGENPETLQFLYDDDFSTGRQLGSELWVNGVTHYVVSGSITPANNWSIRGIRNFYVVAEGSANQTSPGSNVVSVTPGSEEDALALTPPAEQQPNPVLLVGDVSGIYTLITGKKHDTLYLREPFDSVTQDVPIPTPFVKTGLVP